jgi:hypothetical protein
VFKTAAIESESEMTRSTASEGEQTPAAVIGSGEPRTPSMWSAAERTTAAIGSESERRVRRHGEPVLTDGVYAPRWGETVLRSPGDGA